MPVEDAIARCEEQLAPELRREPRPRIPILSALVTLHAEAGRIEVARKLGEEAIEAARENGLVLHLLGAIWACGIAEFTTRNLEQAIDHMRSAFRMRETEDDHALRPAIAAELACMLAFNGDLTKAARLAATARRNDGSDALEGFATGVFWRRALARVAASDGRPDEALRLADDARKRTAASDHLSFHGETLEDVAAVHEQAGDPRGAAAALTEALAVYQRKGNVVGAARVERRLAYR
jgi:tetratricopeptide (TPR) repeat protein